MAFGIKNMADSVRFTVGHRGFGDEQSRTTIDMPRRTPLDPLGETVLRRDGDGKVTILSLASVWATSLSRQGGGAVLVS